MAQLQTTPAESLHKRGSERRKNLRQVIFPLRLLSGDIVQRDRRINADRRRNAFISNLELCRGVPYNRIEAILERCPVQDLEAGEVLLQPDQANHNLYLLLTGCLDINLSREGPHVGFTIQPGESIGEMSIIDGKPTSALVTALEPSSVLEVHENVFWTKIAPIPGAARNLLGTLAERMRRSNEFALRALEQELRFNMLEKELGAAREIQLGMLPADDPLFPHHAELDASAYMETAREVGGDFFDAFSLDQQRVCVAVGDVSGKGMPAALFMVRTLTLLRTELMKGDGLAHGLERLNLMLCKTTSAHMFVSLFVAVIDTKRGEMEYVNAGQNPPLVSLRGEPFEFLEAGSGLIAGILEDSRYEGHRIDLQAGDAIVIYTDGVTEARDERADFYGMPRIRELLGGMPGLDAGEIVAAVRADVEKHMGRAPMSDDITIMALRYRGADPGRD